LGGQRVAEKDRGDENATGGRKKKDDVNKDFPGQLEKAQKHREKNEKRAKDVRSPRPKRRMDQKVRKV